MNRIALVLATGTFALALVTPAHATLNKCAAGKKKCVAKKAQALLKCHTLAEKIGADVATDPKIQACLQKAHDKFDGGAVPGKGCFAKLEAKNPGMCLTTNDTAQLESTTDAFVTDVVTTLDPGYPTPVQNACSAAKKKVTSKQAVGLLKCHAKNEKPPGLDPAAFTLCLSAAHTPVFDGFGNAEAKYSGTCLTTNDNVTISDKVDAFVDHTVCQIDNNCAPTPTPTPTVPCPGPTPTSDPSHSCCVLGPACADIPPYNAGDCLGGAQLIGNCFCTCNGPVVFP
jgi:hypothetical protein